MTLKQRRIAFTANIAKLILFINSSGFQCAIDEAKRTPEMAEIYAKRGIGKKDSQHIKGLAVDLNLYSPEGNYLKTTEAHLPFGEYWEKLNPDNRWGGRFEDGNHYEMRG